MSVRCVHWLSMWLTGLLACGSEGGVEPDAGAQSDAGGSDTPMTAVAVVDHAVGVASALLENSCAGMPVCTYDGQCSMVEGECRAEADDACRRSLSCRDWGSCGAEAGRCVAADTEDCRKAWTCKNKGRCTARGGACVVDEDRDCRRSVLCKRERKCTARKGRCVRKK